MSKIGISTKIKQDQSRSSKFDIFFLIFNTKLWHRFSSSNQNKNCVLIFLSESISLSLSKLITRMVIKYLKGLEKRFQSLVTVTVTYQKWKIYCINFFRPREVTKNFNMHIFVLLAHWLAGVRRECIRLFLALFSIFTFFTKSSPIFSIFDQIL